MSIPIENITAVIVEPARIGASGRREFASLIINVGSKTPDHWYANIYPEDSELGFGELSALVEAQRGDRIIFSGRVRRWTKQTRSGAGTGVTIDIQQAVIKSTR